MKVALRIITILLAGVLVHRAAAEPSVRLLGEPVPGEIAGTAPESVIVHSVSADARWLLITSASDRWQTNDVNGAADLFLVDRNTRTATLISAAPDGHSGDGTSLAGGMALDGSRVAFESRASNLIADDLNRNWDVLVRDLAAGTNALVNIAINGTHSIGPAADPRLSADGRYAFFISPARDLAPAPAFPGMNLYRRDLLEASTVCVTRQFPASIGTPMRFLGSAATPDGHFVVVDLEARTGTGPIRRETVLRNLAIGPTIHCSRIPPPELAGPGVSLHGAGAVNLDGGFVTFRSELTIGGGLTRHGLSLYDVESGTATLLSLRTNQPTYQTFPAAAYRAALSSDGRFVVYSAPWPLDPSQPSGPGRTNGPMQVYLFDSQDQTTRLVSAAPDGITQADADAGEPHVAPDGRGVMFTSGATNLVAGAVAPSQRIYWWDRLTGQTVVAVDLGASSAPSQGVLSPGGEWIVGLFAEVDGAWTVRYFQTADGTMDEFRFEPVAELSSTGPGWMGVQPSGVSADGKYLALAAFPAEPVDGNNHMQVYRLDTQTGVRQLITQGTDGNPAVGHPTLPSISADGMRVLHANAATNLVAQDTNGWRDVFLFEAADSSHRLLRPAGLPTSATHADPVSTLSPNGQFALLGYPSSTGLIAWLAGLPSISFSDPLPAPLVGMPSFSRDDRYLACSLKLPSTEGGRTVHIFDTPLWIADSSNPAAMVWKGRIDSSDHETIEPVLSGDGRRVAFYELNSNTWDVVVVDWAADQELFRRTVMTARPSVPGLSADGRLAVWVSQSAGSIPMNQVWLVDVDTGTVRLVSAAPDGTSDGDGDSKSASISADGRYVAFASLAGNLVADDTNDAKDVFLRDLQTRQTLLVSRTPAGTPARGWSLKPFFSADGRSLFFLSRAPDLAPDDHNQNVDLFKIEILSDSGLFVVIRRNLSTGQSELLWNPSPGKQYAIEYTDGLESTDWVRMPGEFMGDAPIDVDTAAGSKRFFRVLELP